MAKDHFQDIVPQSDDAEDESVIADEIPEAPNAIRSIPITKQRDASAGMERSIRNISAPTRQRPRPEARESRPATLPAKSGSSRRFLWVIAGICLLALGALLLLSLRDTRITVTPRSHSVTFDQSAEYVAFPATAAATGTLVYTVETFELEDSEVAPSQGTVHAEDKASGIITVYNNATTNTFKLVKNTRFQTPDGLVFRAPADISIPGKRGATPGQVDVTVIADMPGESYNVGPTDKFTLPGLSGEPEFTTIYARSTRPMAGGFVGDKPGIAPADLQSATAAVRARLEEKARSQAVAAAGEGRIALPQLIEIVYQDLPQTLEAGGGARVRQRAVVSIPVFDANSFAATIARGVSADAEGSTVRLIPKSGFAAESSATSTSLGAEPISFTMSGTALLVWEVDATALKEALKGKDRAAFEAIVDAFPGVQEASARIQPFWRSSFPSDPSKIRVIEENPEESR